MTMIIKKNKDNHFRNYVSLQNDSFMEPVKPLHTQDNEISAEEYTPQIERPDAYDASNNYEEPSPTTTVQRPTTRTYREPDPTVTDTPRIAENKVMSKPKVTFGSETPDISPTQAGLFGGLNKNTALVAGGIFAAVIIASLAIK